MRFDSESDTPLIEINDYGVAGGKDDGVIFARSRPLRKVHRDEIFDALFEEIQKDGWK